MLLREEQSIRPSAKTVRRGLLCEAAKNGRTATERKHVP